MEQNGIIGTSSFSSFPLSSLVQCLPRNNNNNNNDHLGGNFCHAPGSLQHLRNASRLLAILAPKKPRSRPERCVNNVSSSLLQSRATSSVHWTARGLSPRGASSSTWRHSTTSGSAASLQPRRPSSSPRSAPSAPRPPSSPTARLPPASLSPKIPKRAR